MHFRRSPVTSSALCLSAAIGIAGPVIAQERPASAAATRPSATRPAADAGDLYRRAEEAIVVDSPANSVMEHPNYPPYGPEWTRLAIDAWERNGRARELARAARSTTAADWPRLADRKYLNDSRRLTNDLGDAALHQHLRGNDAAAVELVRDVLHLARLLREHGPAEDAVVRHLVATGMETSALDRLLVIASAVEIADDPAYARALSAGAARELVAQLSDPPDVPRGPLREAFAARPDPTGALEARAVADFERVRAEHGLAAISVAAHLFRHREGRWPRLLDEMVPADLPRAPIDPFGDGTQPLGYALIAGGLPDGSDRPLVYTRDDSPDGLQFRTDRPFYGRSMGDGSDRLSRDLLHTGQFRDVARWAAPPAEDAGPQFEPALAPLP